MYSKKLPVNQILIPLNTLYSWKPIQGRQTCSITKYWVSLSYSPSYINDVLLRWAESITLILTPGRWKRIERKQEQAGNPAWILIDHSTLASPYPQVPAMNAKYLERILLTLFTDSFFSKEFNRRSCVT